MTQDDQKSCPVFPFVLGTESLEKRVLRLKGLLDKILQKLPRNMQSSVSLLRSLGCLLLAVSHYLTLMGPFIHHTVLGLILLS